MRRSKPGMAVSTNPRLVGVRFLNRATRVRSISSTEIVLPMTSSLRCFRRGRTVTLDGAALRAHPPQPMDFGLFLEFETRPTASQAVVFREGFELVDAAEAWGVDSVWLAEIHFTPARSVLSAPIAVASAIAARTKRLRVGLAVQVLPLNNPLRIAEEAATVDHISEGRFDFGIGRSGFPRVYDLYGVPYAESQARFREALEIILEAWKGEPFSYAGEFYRFENATVAPRPYQLPHPPLRMAATTEETFPKVGEMGLPIFVGLRGMDVSTLRHHVLAYRRAWRDAGHPGHGNVY